MSSEQRTYTVAIAGMGKRGTHHAEAFSQNPRFQLVGLCDIDRERMDAAAQKFGISYTNIDAAQMLADTKPDIFAFCFTVTRASFTISSFASSRLLKYFFSLSV